MKKLTPLLTLFFATLLFSHTAQAQNSSSGKEFWIGYIAGQNVQFGVQLLHLAVYISSDVSTSGTITAMSNNFSVPFEVVPDRVTTIILANNAFREVPYNGSETVHKLGIRITADDPISVYTSAGSDFSMDATIVLPTTALGTIYRSLNYKNINYSDLSELLVVATMDNTEIEITPSAITERGRPANQPFTITLNKGEVYMVASLYDLSNSKIIGKDPCKPFAVFSGEACASIPFNTKECCCDMIFDQMYPIRTWGRHYATVPLFSREKGEPIRIIAAEDNTRLTINGGQPKFINSTSYYEFITDQPTIIQADKPIAVAQYSTSGGYDGKVGDPFMISLQSTKQTIDKTVFSTIATPNTSWGDNMVKHYLNVIMHTEDVPGFTIDGLQNPPYATYEFKPFPADNSLSYAQVYILPDGPATPHILEAGGAGFIAYGYDFSKDQSFGYAEGFNRQNLANTFTATNPACKDAPVTFVPFILTDQSFDEYKWDFGDGSISNEETPTHQYTTTGTFTVTMFLIDNSGTCGNIIDSVSSTIQIKDGIGANAGEDKLICQNDGIQIGAPPVAGLTYSWSPATGLSDPAISNPIASPQYTTLYTLTISNNASICNASDEVMLTVDPLPWAVYTYIKNGLTVEFFGIDNHGITSWEWDFGDRSVPSTEQNPVHTFVQTDNFTVTLIVTNKCGKDTVMFDLNVDGTSGNGGNTGLQQGGAVLEKLNVYPNPFNTELNIDFILQQPAVLSIGVFDVLGRSIYEHVHEENLTAGKYTYQLNSQKLPEKGLYYLKIGLRDEIHYIKISNL